jgi:hypothetical protein
MSRKFARAGAAGAHGKLTAPPMIRVYHANHDEGQRNKSLIPDSAHGTNPASTTMAGKFPAMNGEISNWTGPEPAAAGSEGDRPPRCASKRPSELGSVMRCAAQARNFPHSWSSYLRDPSTA